MLKKKVLLVICKPVGGIRTFMRYVYRRFDPERWSFTILAPDIAEMRLLIDDLSGQDVKYVPTDGNTYPSPLLLALKVTRELMLSKYDLVHSHGFTSGFCTALSAKLRRTKHLMTSHDVINENRFNGTKGNIEKQVMSRLLALIDTIHSVSYDAEKNLLLHFPALTLREGRSVVISNGIEVERFCDAVPRDLRGELGFDEKSFLIGFFGRFMSQKGFRYLVDAIDLLRKDKSLFRSPMVLSFGDGGFIREEKQAIRERGLEEYFYFMPFVSNIACSIKGLDVVAMPSLWEACPLLPMEVLSCGTPLIVSDCIGLREVVRGTPATVIPAADSYRLAQALLQEMGKCSKSEFISFKGSAERIYDVSVTWQKIHQLYENMTSIDMNL